MVLNSQRSKFRALAIWTLSFVISHGVYAEASSASRPSGFRFDVQNSDCVVRFKRDGEWVLFNKKIPVGTPVIARLTEPNSDVVIFRATSVSTEVLAAKASCIMNQRGAVGMENSGPGGNTGFKPLTGKSFYQRLSFGPLSWQEGLSTKFGAVQKNLRATNFGLSLHYQRVRRVGSDEWMFGVQPFYAKARVSASDISSVKTEDDGVPRTVDAYQSNYSARNVDVLGTVFNIGYHFIPSSEGVAFGATLPFMVRYGIYPTALESGQVAAVAGPKLWFLLGLMLENRLELGGFSFSTRVGFLNKPTALAWGFEGGFAF